jgi:hypothetical protein
MAAYLLHGEDLVWRLAVYGTIFLVISALLGILLARYFRRKFGVWAYILVPLPVAILWEALYWLFIR